MELADREPGPLLRLGTSHPREIYVQSERFQHGASQAFDCAPAPPLVSWAKGAFELSGRARTFTSSTPTGIVLALRFTQRVTSHLSLRAGHPPHGVTAFWTRLRRGHPLTGFAAASTKEDAGPGRALLFRSAARRFITAPQKRTGRTFVRPAFIFGDLGSLRAYRRRRTSESPGRRFQPRSACRPA